MKWASGYSAHSCLRAQRARLGPRSVCTSPVPKGRFLGLLSAVGGSELEEQQLGVSRAHLSIRSIKKACI